MRGVKADQAVRQRKFSHLRRRFDISLGSNGAEIQLPALPFIRPNARWISGLLTIAIIALLYTIWHAPEYKGRIGQIEGLRRLPEREIHSVLAVEDRQIFALNPVDLEIELLTAFPEFSDAEISIGWPNLVTVRVEEREPALGWEHSQGLVYIDGAGFSFPARGDSSGIPMVLAPEMVIAPIYDENGEQVFNPFIGRQLLSAQQVDALRTLYAEAPEEAEMLFDPSRGMGWRDPRGWDVYFGIHGDDMPQRLAVYKALKKELRENGHSPALISIEFLDAPYYRWER